MNEEINHNLQYSSSLSGKGKVIPVNVKLNMEFTVEQDTKTQRGSRRIALLFL